MQVADETGEAVKTTATNPVVVELVDEDIPGATLSEPLEAKNNAALRWWLQCHGIKAPPSWNKKQLVTRVRDAQREEVKVVDVDGSYLSRKHQQLRAAGVSVVPLGPPTLPPSGWITMGEANYAEVARKMPRMLPGTLYSYLAEGVGHSKGDGAFRALSRGYTHWASGRMDQLQVNVSSTQFCHVKCRTTPSMKPGKYEVYVLLERDAGNFAKISLATCDCAAGKSATCTHVSALLHALVAMTPSQSIDKVDIDEEDLPVTSYPCQWKPPRQRKQSNTRISDIHVEKHTFGKQKKIELLPLEEFDPRPQKYRQTAPSQLDRFLEKVRGKGLGVSLLFDSTTKYWANGDNATATALPCSADLCYSIQQFKHSLRLSVEACTEIERDTRGQRLSSLWFSVRRYRLTASHFGDIYRRRRETKPDGLVLRVLQPKQISSPAIEWGVQQEAAAIEAYKKQQLHCGHQRITVCPVGFLMCQDHPFLGASPDGTIYDPTHPDPYGFLEVKCPYSHRDHTPEVACSDPLFCCELRGDSKVVSLKCGHKYYCQIQGQMAIGSRSWCDFVVYTSKGINIERIAFDALFWNDELLPKLKDFYDNCMAPEIISPVHMIGMPLRDLREN